MSTSIQHWVADERGSVMVEWIGVSAIVLAIIATVWTAFYGLPGEQLRSTVQDVMFMYANGFEGGLGTEGPMVVPRNDSSAPVN